ncbi:MAG: tetratricopeptide repeat protein [Campylobacterota bacterium]|nr:tetratricopeptide repeat protein [Campylobacterota bacterium]
MIKKNLLLLVLLFNITLFADTAYNNGLKAYQAKQYTPALKYFYVSARHHNINAYVELGAMHEYGIGTGTNLQTAFYWYQKAAKRNHPRAQYQLGHLYETGTGVGKDMKSATFWYQKAAKNGNKKAKVRLSGKDPKDKSADSNESEGFFSKLVFWR